MQCHLHDQRRFYFFHKGNLLLFNITSTLFIVEHSWKNVSTPERNIKKFGYLWGFLIEILQWWSVRKYIFGGIWRQPIHLTQKEYCTAIFLSANLHWNFLPLIFPDIQKCMWLSPLPVQKSGNIRATGYVYFCIQSKSKTSVAFIIAFWCLLILRLLIHLLFICHKCPVFGLSTAGVLLN